MTATADEATPQTRLPSPTEAAVAPFFTRAVAAAVYAELGLHMPDNVQLEVHPLGLTHFECDTDLARRLNIDDLRAHTIIQRALAAVIVLNTRVELMQRYNGLAGLRVMDVPLFQEKLGFLARQLDPEVHGERLHRVLELADLPEVDPNVEVKDVDMTRLIGILDSFELQRFRAWLRGIDDIEDAQIEEEIRRVRDLARRAVRSPTGKAVRFSVLTALGFVPGGQLPAIGLGALDSFLLDKLVGAPGPTAFLSQLYPSMFQTSV